MNPFIGEIIMFAGNFAPRGWAFCNGQLLSISENTALFSLLGTTYGGDGRTTMGLPDLRGRCAMHAGTGPGLTPRSLGAKFGDETATITVASMPSHKHTTTLHAESTAGSSNNPTGNLLGGGGSKFSPSAAAANVTMNAESIVVADTGGGQAHNNIQPVEVVNFIIALQGVYPSRN